MVLLVITPFRHAADEGGYIPALTDLVLASQCHTANGHSIDQINKSVAGVSLFRRNYPCWACSFGV